MSKKWTGCTPEVCDICGIKITDIFYDGRTYYGPWANMCPTCFKENGVGLGTGSGQLWGKVNNEFVKIEG